MLRVRWLGRVAYTEATDLQRALHERADDDYLLLLEHPHVYTLGVTAKPEHVLVPPARVGAEVAHADRGGDVTYHGPGQLVGYPIVTLPEWRDGMRDVVAYVRRLEGALIAALADLGVAAERDPRYPGVWVQGSKIAAVGVKVARRAHPPRLRVERRSRSRHVRPHRAVWDPRPRGHVDRGVLGAVPEMRDVVDVVVDRLVAQLGLASADVERQDVVWRERPEQLSRFTRDAAEGADPGAPGAPVRLLGRLAEAGVTAGEPQGRRPEWMRVRADLGEGYRETRRLMRGLDLHTVCEEAGCPNIYECWADGTATFMILGDRCTRACGFCLVDTRRPLELDPDEPARVADAIARLGLEHAVITSVARDDVADGGAAGFAATIAAVRARTPRTRIEVLVPDCKGDATALETIVAARPDVLNHNLETVARLQRAARPSAAYARSLTLLSRAKEAGLVTKSGIILGMGETGDEVCGAIADLRNVGVDILTLGQYLRPSPRHLPVVRWWTPDEFASFAAYAEALGFAHVEAGPLVRSSYHAKRAVDAAVGAPDVASGVSA